MFSSKIQGSKKTPYYFTHVGELKTSCVNVLLITCKISPSSAQFGIFSMQSNISFQLFYMSGRSQKIIFVKANTAKFDMYCNLANILGKQIFPFSRFLQYWRIFQQHSRSEIKSKRTFSVFITQIGKSVQIQQMRPFFYLNSNPQKIGKTLKTAQKKKIQKNIQKKTCIWFIFHKTLMSLFKT